jgi:hypothetical protein
VFVGGSEGEPEVALPVITETRKRTRAPRRPPARRQLTLGSPSSGPERLLQRPSVRRRWLVRSPEVLVRQLKESPG